MSRQIKPCHRVYMLFNLRKHWQVSFLEADLMVSPLKTLIFSDPEEIRGIPRGSVKRWERPRRGHCSITLLGAGTEDSTFN